MCYIVFETSQLSEFESGYRVQSVSLVDNALNVKSETYCVSVLMW